MKIRLGVDVACRAAHQASLADEQGRVLFVGHRFRTDPDELDTLWARLPKDALEADLELKQRALDRTVPIASAPGRYHPPNQLIAFLEGL